MKSRAHATSIGVGMVDSLVTLTAMRRLWRFLAEAVATRGAGEREGEGEGVREAGEAEALRLIPFFGMPCESRGLLRERRAKLAEGSKRVL